MSHDTAVEEDGLEVGRGEKRQEEKQETAVERRQKEEEMMAADQADIQRDRSQDDVEKEEDGQFRWEEWDWESMVGEAGLAHEAFELRRSKVLRRQDDAKRDMILWKKRLGGLTERIDELEGRERGEKEKVGW